MTDFRALCVELTDCLEKADWPHRYKIVFQQWTDIARAALAEPADDEVAELVAWLRATAETLHEGNMQTPRLTRAADLLERLSPPQPVLVNERLPEPGDCDAEGRCWIHMPDMGTAPSWRLVDPRDIGPYHTHWLPAHALPVPS